MAFESQQTILAVISTVLLIAHLSNTSPTGELTLKKQLLHNQLVAKVIKMIKTEFRKSEGMELVRSLQLSSHNTETYESLAAKSMTRRERLSDYLYIYKQSSSGQVSNQERQTIWKIGTLVLEAFYELEMEAEGNYEALRSQAAHQEAFESESQQRDSEPDITAQEDLSVALVKYTSQQKLNNLFENVENKLNEVSNEMQAGASAINEPTEESRFFDFIHVDQAWKKALCETLAIACNDINVPQLNSRNVLNVFPPDVNGQYYVRVKKEDVKSSSYRAISFAITGIEKNYDVFKKLVDLFSAENSGLLVKWMGGDLSYLFNGAHHSGERTTDLDMTLLSYILGVRIYVYKDQYRMWELMDPRVLPKEDLPVLQWTTDRAIFLHKEGKEGPFNVVYGFKALTSQKIIDDVHSSVCKIWLPNYD